MQVVIPAQAGIQSVITDEMRQSPLDSVSPARVNTGSRIKYGMTKTGGYLPVHGCGRGRGRSNGRSRATRYVLFEL